MRYNKNMKIAILGYGVEGKSAEKFLRKEFKAARLEIRDIKLQGKGYLKNLEKFDMIVRSPGIPFLSPEIRRAKKKGVEITSSTKLFFENAKGILVGITGTKGKGTTATLLYKILKANHLGSEIPSRGNIHLIGNMGIPMLDELPKLKKNSISVLELSSFQLQDLDYSPHIAVILDISPDHLNYHKNFKEYLNAKEQIVSNPPPYPPPFIREGGEERFYLSSRGRVSSYPWKVFYFPDNKFSKQIAQKSKGKKIGIVADPNLILKIPGAHNLKNASMAAAVARALGAKEDIIKKVIRNFKGLPHRLEFVREIRGVKFYNDSASTNPAATVAALKAFDAPKILIAGGAGKNLDYAPIGKALKNSNTKLVVLNGENKKEIGSALGKAPPTIYVENLKSAIKLAFRKAKKGDIILLSPASTAFDQFSGYGERGKVFKKLVAGA